MAYQYQPFGSVYNTQAYQDASKMFGQDVDPYKSQLVQGLLSQGERAGAIAKNQAISNLAKQGFGRSTFGEQIGQSVQSKASQPFFQQASGVAEQVKQQQTQNFMNTLNQLLAEQRQREATGVSMEQFQQQFGLERDKFNEAVRQYDAALAAKRAEQEATRNLGFLDTFAPGITSFIGGPLAKLFGIK